MSNTNQHKVILKDFLKSYFIVILISIIVESTIRISSMYAAKIIGNGVDALYLQNEPVLKTSMISIIIVLLITIVMVPLLSLLQNSLMIHGGLSHDRRVYKHFFKKDLQYAKSYAEGELVSRLDDDIRFFRFALTDFSSNIGTLIITLFSLSFLIFQVPIYAFFCVLMSIIPIVVAHFTKNLKKGYLEYDKGYYDERAALENNIYDKYLVIKTNNLLNIFTMKIQKLFMEYYKNTLEKSIKLNRLIELINKLSSILSQLFVVLFGFYLLSKEIIQPGAIATYVLYQKSIQDIINLIATIINNKKDYEVNKNRLEVFYQDEEVSGSEFINDINKIHLKQLSFYYKDKKVLKNINLHIENKDKIIIYGENGSGKSTLIKLITTLYTYYHGKIYYNGHDRENLNIENVRSLVSYLEQDPYIYEDTLINNLSIDANSEKGNVHDLIKDFNLEYLNNRKVIKHNELSGGEKQKIALIRCLLKNAKVYILDEPNNNLDKDTLSKLPNIIKNIEETVIVITHQSDNAEYFNKTYTMKDGIIY